jgi:hypothetical protein
VPRGQRDGSLRPYSWFSRQEPLLFYQVALQLYSRGRVDPVPEPLLFFLVVPGIEPGPPDLYPRTLTTRPQRRSPTSNKLLIYKTILKPIWSYGMQLWGTASTSNIEIVERFVDTPRYVPNTVIRRDLRTPTVKEEIRRYSSQYSARLSTHPHDSVVNLMEQPYNSRRLRTHLSSDLPPTSCSIHHPNHSSNLLMQLIRVKRR